MAYFGCLEQHGVTLERRDDGQLRVDKDATAKDPDSLTRAEAACKDRVPPRRDEKPSAKTLAASKAFSACMRRQGFADYPDPDPETGDTRLPASVQSKGMDRLRAAQRSCAPGAGSDSGVLGG
ncbi:hypothetical protein [Streptomyces sp. NPDC006134]|uniref:hypothetical protein n=1 Tax=Streptomyces sp. NPDC006134 TaxID=3154467 RepID=UPI0033D818C0